MSLLTAFGICYQHLMLQLIGVIYSAIYSEQIRQETTTPEIRAEAKRSTRNLTPVIHAYIAVH